MIPSKLQKETIVFFGSLPIYILILTFILGLVLDNRFLLFLGVGMTLESTTVTLLKRMFAISGKKFTLRPKGARDCGNFALCSRKRPKESGMPSGHSMAIAFAMTFIILTILHEKKKNTQKVISTVIGIFLILGVTIQRVKVKCHTIPQVIVGSIIGGTMAVGYYYLIKKYLPNGIKTKLY